MGDMSYFLEWRKLRLDLLIYFSAACFLMKKHRDQGTTESAYCSLPAWGNARFKGSPQ